MNAVRRAADALLWVLAVIGVLSGATWAASTAGLIQPLVVVSGSMEPSIRTGDLLVAIPTPAADLLPVRS